MAINIGVRRLRGFGLGTGWLKRSARPYCQRGDEQFVKRHKLAPELEMQHGSAQSQEKFLGSVGLEGGNSGQSRRAKEGERDTIPADPPRYWRIRAELRPSWRGFVALSHEPLGSDVNALQRLVVGDRNRRHCRERSAHGVQWQ